MRITPLKSHNCKKVLCQSWTGQRRTAAKAFAKHVFADQERKSEDRRRSDTVLVPTVNAADWASRPMLIWIGAGPLPRETLECPGSGGSTVAKLKLKGIDGRAPPGVEPAA